MYWLRKGWAELKNEVFFVPVSWTPTPESLIASSFVIVMPACWLFHGAFGFRPIAASFACHSACSAGSSSSPPSVWSIGYFPFSSAGILWHHFSMSFGSSFTFGAAWARFRAGWSL